MSPELFDMISKKLSPKDILPLCQSSLAAEKWHYSLVPNSATSKPGAPSHRTRVVVPWMV